MPVRRVHAHPKYDSYWVDFDFALLEIECINFSDKVRPACLPKDDEEKFAGFNGTISGWGTYDQIRGSQPNLLQETVVPIISNRECRTRWPPSWITDQMICIATPGTGSCSGDSGGLWRPYSLRAVFVLKDCQFQGQ